MADDSDDPDVQAGRAIAGGTKASGSSATVDPDDPDVAAGRAIATVKATGDATQIPPPSDPWWTWSGLGRNVAAAGPRIAGNVINLLSNPSANLVGYPLIAAGQAAHDFFAPMLGGEKLSEEDRNALYADFADQPGNAAIKTLGSIVPGGPPINPYDIKGTPTEKTVGSIAEGAGTAGVTGPGGIARATAGGVGGGTGEVAAENVPDWLKPFAGLTGNVAGATATGAGTALQRVVRGAVTDVSPADAALGQLALKKYDIPIDANDLSSNSLYRIAADQAGKLPFSGAAPAAAAKQSAWQGAIAQEMGEPGATSFTSDVMDNARTRIGGVFDQVAKNTHIDAASTDTLTNVDLPKIEADMHQILPTTELPKIKAQLDNIIDVASKQNGTISGDSYQALTRKGAPLDLAERSTDPNVRHVAGQIRDALDDAFVRSASPADQAALAQAKYQYRVMRTIDPLVAGSRDGNISPDAFMQKVLTASRKFDSPTGGIAYTGGGNIGELARIGKLMRAPPQTGTADRSLINLLALGGTGAPLFMNPAYAATVPAILAANRFGGAYLRSGGLANRVAGNALHPPLPSPFVFGAPVLTGADRNSQQSP
jgi:hypothetical protein